MKQKYNITVADMQLNIISDASQDEVENIVGILDRRMRDINLKSPRCTKNEAAILCALSYCSERIAVQEAYKKVEKDAFRYAAENERLKKTVEELQAELETLRQDNATMRSILDHAATATQTPAKTVESEKPAPQVAAAVQTEMEIPVFRETPAPVSEQPSVEAPSAKVESGTPVVEEPEEKPNKAANKSRVGTMFDLLTFSDV